MTQDKPTPRRIVEHPKSELRPLLEAACRLEPPQGAQERIWQRLALARARLVEGAEEDVVVRDLVRQAARLEPPQGAQERIWRRLEEEALVRAGLAEPRRLLDTDDALAPLLARAAELEPPLGRKGRILHALRPEPRRPWLQWSLGGLSAAAVAGLVFALWPHSAPEAGPALALALSAGGEVQIAHAPGSTGAPGALVPGDRLHLAGTSRARLHIQGVGDAILTGAGAELALARADATGVRLELSQGSVSIHADKRSRSAPLVVGAGGAEVQVVGTIFTVDAAQAATQVFVHEGLVEVRFAGEVARVGAGQSWQAGGARPEQFTPAADQAMRELAGESLTASHIDAQHADSQLADRQPQSAAAQQQPKAIGKTRPEHLAAKGAQPSLAERPSARGFDLAREAQRFEGLSAAELSTRIVALRKEGDLQGAAGAYRVLANAPGTTAPERLSAIVSLSQLLDGDLAEPRLALDVRREIARRSAVVRSAERLEILEALVELGDSAQGLAAAEECLRDCDEQARTFARFIQARLLLDQGRTDEARQAMDAARQQPGADKALALHFGLRAQRHAGFGQRDRARAAARFSLALDPNGANAPVVRRLAGLE